MTKFFSSIKTANYSVSNTTKVPISNLILTIKQTYQIGSGWIQWPGTSQSRVCIPWAQCSSGRSECHRGRSWTQQRSGSSGRSWMESGAIKKNRAVLISPLTLQMLKQDLNLLAFVYTLISKELLRWIVYTNYITSVTELLGLILIFLLAYVVL